MEGGPPALGTAVLDAAWLSHPLRSLEQVFGAEQTGSARSRSEGADVSDETIEQRVVELEEGFADMNLRLDEIIASLRGGPEGAGPAPQSDPSSPPSSSRERQP